MTTKQLAEALGCSERTGQRWFANESSPSAMTMIDLARLVYPVNEPLAAEIAASAGRVAHSSGFCAGQAVPEGPARVTSRTLMTGEA
jgi:transcriptional regulator with XRE-family HTH domain